MHTPAALFLTGKPFKDTPENDDFTSALSSLGLRLVSFETSLEVYLTVFPKTAQENIIIQQEIILVIQASSF